jgi:biotin transport system substrate-specific component
MSFPIATTRPGLTGRSGRANGTARTNGFNSAAPAASAAFGFSTTSAAHAAPAGPVGPAAGFATKAAGINAATSVKNIALVVAGAAWIAGLSQVAIPLGFTPVPLSLGTFAVLTTGAALGARRAAASAALFLIAGLAGVPVFAGGQSGFGPPTIGYAIGYVIAAALIGHATRATQGRADHSFGRFLAIMALGTVVIYLIGVPYLVAVVHVSWADGIVQGVVPFLIGDLIKALAAAALVPGVGRAHGGRGGPGPGAVP